MLFDELYATFMQVSARVANHSQLQQWPQSRIDNIGLALSAQPHPLAALTLCDNLQPTRPLGTIA